MKRRRTIEESHIPILRGIVSRNGKTIQVYCPLCSSWHVHGYCGGEGLSHRAAHCHVEHRFKHGYFIAPFRKKDMAIIQEDQP